MLTLPKGILGFPGQVRYALIGGRSNGGQFYWLQSTERSEVGFLAADPQLFDPDYSPKIEGFDKELSRLLVIVSEVEGVLTVNLQGPIVVDNRIREARQEVIINGRYNTRSPLA